MKGNAVCNLDTSPPEDFEFKNVTLTYISGESLAILSRETREDRPEEMLVMESVTLDILSRTEIDLKGFVCPKEEEKRFFRCHVKFRL